MNIKRILAVKGSNVITIGPEDTIKQAITLLNERRIGALVVTDQERRVVGILSERDIIRYIDSADANLDKSVSLVMTRNVVTGVPEDDVHAVAHVMTERRFRHLPVVVDGRLIGIISIGDVLKAQRDSYRGEIDTLEVQLLADEEDDD
jgi:CBS domain-containing protein